MSVIVIKTYIYARFLDRYRKAHQGNCLAQIYHKHEELIACNRQISVATEPVYFAKIEDGWVYSAINPITIAVSCPHIEVRQVYLEQGAGRLNISNACKVSANNFILPSTVEISGKPKNYTIPIIKFNLTLMPQETKAIDIIHSEPLLTDIIETMGGTIPLSALDTELANIPSIHRIRKMNSYTSISSLTIGTITLVLIISAFVFTVHAYRVCRNYANQEGSGDVALQQMA